MAVTHDSCTRNDIAVAVTSLLGAAGYLELQTGGAVEVATLTFSNPAFAAPALGVSSANAITADVNATGGTMTVAAFYSSAANRIMTCSVSTTGGTGDIKFNSITVLAAQQVTITSLSYTAPT